MKKNKILAVIKILILVLIISVIFLFFAYKIFHLNWLFKIIGPQTYEATFEINGADWISKKSLSCTTNSSFTCKVKAPEIKKNGALIIGWGYEEDSTEASFMPGDEIVLDSKKTRFYAITKQRIKTSKVIDIDILTVEFEDNLKYSKSINSRIESLHNLYSKWPFMFKYREKLTFLTEDSFEKFNNVDYDGSNNWTYRYIDIKEANSDYTMIHELAHALDFNCTYGLYRITRKSANWKNNRYSTIFNHNAIKLISESNEYEFVNLYNKYKNISRSERPLKDYSYSNVHEFFADALTYYYDYKYENQYYDLVNNDIVAAVEELIKDINSGKICTNKINQEFRIGD